jgi:hypothetical protein
MPTSDAHEVGDRGSRAALQSAGGDRRRAARATPARVEDDSQRPEVERGHRPDDVQRLAGLSASVDEHVIGDEHRADHGQRRPRP